MNVTSMNKALESAGFELNKANNSAQDVAGMPGHKLTECITGIHSLGKVLVCLHEFEESSQAIDAGTTIGLRQWPQSKKRVSFVTGHLVVTIYSDLPDTGVADEAFDALKDI